MSIRKLALMLALAFCTLTLNAQNIRKVLVMGDSMTGFLAERLNAYGQLNGFEVDALIWDGATLQKYADSPKLAQIIAQKNPDLVVVSLGLNNLFETAPDKRLNSSVDKIFNALGNRDVVWVGPPSWPGKDKGQVLNSWLDKKVGHDRYFSTFDMKLPRQSSTNPHPTQAGCSQVIDSMVTWIEANPTIPLNLQKKPAAGKVVRPAAWTYRRMKQTL